MRRIGTMNIKEILQHRHGLGLTRAQTATAVGVSTGTVSHILERAAAAGLSWPLPDSLDDEALRARLYPSVARDAGCVQPDWEAVLAELGRKRQRRRTPGDTAPALGRVPRRSTGKGRDALQLQPLLCPAQRTPRPPGGRGADALRLRAGAVGPVGLLGQDAGVAHRARRDGRGDLRRRAGPLADALCRGGARPERASLDDGAPARSGVLRRRPLTLDHRQPQGRRSQGRPRGAPGSIRASASSRSTTTSPCYLHAREGRRTRGSWSRRSARSRPASCWRCATRPSSRSTR